MVSQYWLSCLDINLESCFSMNAERSKFLSFWECECSHWWWRAGISDSVCVCGSDDKLLRDNQTISPDGEERQSEDIMNCQYRERERLCLELHTYRIISAVYTGKKLQLCDWRLTGQIRPLVEFYPAIRFDFNETLDIRALSAENSLASSEALSGQLAIRGAKFRPERGHLSLFWP